MYRKIAFLLMVAFVLSGSAAFGIVPMGPPTAVLKEGQLSIGFDYGHSKGNVDFVIEADDADAKGTFNDMRSNSFLGRLGYGLYRYEGNWDVYLLFGAANADQDKFEFGGDYGFSGGFATKLTLFKDGNLSLGALYQMQWSRSRDSFTLSAADIDTEVDWYEIQAAVGPTYQIGGLRIYGGPGLYYIDGDVDYDATNGGFSYSVDFDQKTEFSGYAGIELNIMDNSYLYVEYQATDDAEAAGGGICWRF